MLYPLQLALTAPEFSDILVFRNPPAAVQRVLFGTLAPIARRRGYRATYPTLSRATLAPRKPRDAPPRPESPRLLQRTSRSADAHQRGRLEATTGIEPV
jgi:hypothetical protein